MGGRLEDESKFFEGCRVVAMVHLPYDVQNEESADHPQILVCHRLKAAVAGVWGGSRGFRLGPAGLARQRAQVGDVSRVAWLADESEC